MLFLKPGGFVEVERNDWKEVVDPAGFALSVLILLIFILVVNAFGASEGSMIICTC